jgi:hypothetical protein
LVGLTSVTQCYWFPAGRVSCATPFSPELIGTLPNLASEIQNWQISRERATLTVLVDDQTVSGLLRQEVGWPDDDVFTTGSWYLRLCQAVVRGAGGALSGPLLSLPPSRRESALRAVLELPEQIQMLSWREVAPTMASQLGGPGQGLNLLSREALAVASMLRAEVIMAVGNENRLLRNALRVVGLS